MLINKRPKIFWITYNNCLPFKCEIQDKHFFVKCKIKRAKKYEQFSLSYIQNLRTIFIALATHLLHIDPVSTCFLGGRVTASLHLVLLVWSSGFKWAKMTTGHLATAHSPAVVMFSENRREPVVAEIVLIMFITQQMLSPSFQSSGVHQWLRIF